MNIFYKTLQYLSISGVKFYRKFISPYKGFHCGHSHYTGGLSCSTYGLTQLQLQNNPLEALRLISHRLKACSHVTALFKENNPLKYSMLNKQSGFVDCDCGGCDIPNTPDCDCDSKKCNHCDNVCDVADICDCDFQRKKKKPVTIDSIENEPALQDKSTTKISLKKEGSLIIPNFQLLDELEENYFIYKYLLTGEYYKIHKSCIDKPEVDILSGNTEPPTEKLDADKVKKMLKYRKRHNQ